MTVRHRIGAAGSRTKYIQMSQMVIPEALTTKNHVTRCRDVEDNSVDIKAQAKTATHAGSKRQSAVS